MIGVHSCPCAFHRLPHSSGSARLWRKFFAGSLRVTGRIERPNFRPGFSWPRSRAQLPTQRALDGPVRRLSSAPGPVAVGHAMALRLSISVPVTGTVWRQWPPYPQRTGCCFLGYTRPRASYPRIPDIIEVKIETKAKNRRSISYRYS